MSATTLDFHDDPAAFLAEAGDHLGRRPVLHSVVATAAARADADDAAGIAPDPPTPYRWWVVVREGTDVVGVGMRTAPFAPHPLFLLMPEAGARALARTLHERGEPVAGVNGSQAAATACAEELAGLTGGRVRTGLETRLHQLEEVVTPEPAPGALRAARMDDVDLVMAWFEAFAAAADEQAGRSRGSMHRVTGSVAAMRRRLGQEQVWLWVDGSGTPVHLSGRHPTTHGAARIAPVYTPPAHRGHRYAGNAVAALSQRILDQGAVPCLFTDLANPVSGRLYASLGFRPVADMVDLVVDPPLS